MYSPEESMRIQQYRQKVNDGTITKEELKEALMLLRKGREGAHATSTASRTRKAASKQPINSDSLLDELGGM
jgi:hypothetical protein